ncbi:hypothetical protein D3C72_59180 [compost metagenome]
MASVNDNLSTQRSSGASRPAAAPGAAAGAAAGSTPPASSTTTPAVRPRTPTDKALIAARPQSEAERQNAMLQAVRAAQGKAEAPAKASEKAPAKEEDSRTAKVIADGIGVADGIREGARIATNADELARLPGIGRAMQNGSRFGKFFAAIAESKLGKAISTALQHNKVLAPAARFLGRIAPFAGLAVAGYDIYDATKTHKDPKASSTERFLASTKAALSGISGVAGVATLALAPTGIGAAIAGGVALGAGLLSLGVDLFLGKLRKDRQAAASKA